MILTSVVSPMLSLGEQNGRHIDTRARAPLVHNPINLDPVTAQLQRLYRQAVRGELDEFRHWLTPS